MKTNRMYNLEAEGNLLGVILNNNNKMLDVIDILKPTDFYKTAHKVIYNTMVNLYTANKSIELVTLTEALKDQLNEIGGISYISDLIGTATIGNVKNYAEIIKEKSKIRSLNLLLQQTLKEVQEGNKKSNEIINFIDSKSLELAEEVKKNLINDGQLMDLVMNKIQDNYENGADTLLGIESKIKTIDRGINGFRKKKLYIIAGRPGMGKSALVINIIQNIAETHRIAYFSLEMEEEEIGFRRLAMKSYVDSQIIERASMDEKQWQSIMNTASFISKGNCITNCTPGISMNTVKAQCKKLKLQGGLDMIVIDHIGIMNLTSMGPTIREQITNICIQLKNLSKELDVPVLALSQLSRNVEQRLDKRPMLSDLKESGGIEENADVVMFLYRDGYYNKETEEPNIIELNIAKQRGGRTGTVKLSWLPQYQKIGDLDYVHEGTYNPDIFKGGK